MTQVQLFQTNLFVAINKYDNLKILFLLKLISIKKQEQLHVIELFLLLERILI